MTKPKFRIMAAAAISSCLLVAGASAQTFSQTLVTQFAPESMVGSATVAPNDVDTFAAAIPGSLGGVFDFGAALTAGSTVLSGTAGTDSPRTIQLTFSRALQNITTGTYTASSGNRGITTQSTPGDYGFAIGEVMDTASPSAPIPGLHVTRLGFVALSRTNPGTETAFPLDLRATATLSNGFTQTATGMLSGTRGENVFFGFTAAAGTAIAHIALEAFVPGTSTPVSSRIALDDIVTIIEDTGPLVPAPSLSEITPENSYLPPGETFDFGASSPNGVNSGNLAVTLNGVDAASQLVLAGTPNERIVSISGLTAGVDYEAVVTVNDASGVATRTFHFTTREALPTFTDITPDGSYMTASGVFQFQVNSTFTMLDSSNISVTLNGTNANGQVTIHGLPNEKIVTLSGFTPNTVHRAEVSVTVSSGTSTRYYHIHTLGEPLAISNTRGFSDNTIYPIGPITPFVDGFSRWAPHAATTNVAEIIDSGEPAHGKIFRRSQGEILRADFLYFPPLADGVLKVAFDARVSNATHRTLDISLQPDSANGQLMAGFIQFGRTSEKLSYYDNAQYFDIEGFTLDTAWHSYEMVHYHTGPKALTCDLHVDGQFIANIPWRSQQPLTLARMRVQTNARDVPLDETGLHAFADIDNIRITGLPLPPAALPPPVTVTELGKGVVYRKYTQTDLFSSNQNIHVTDINLEDPSVALEFPYSGANPRSVATHASNVPGAVAAVNGQLSGIAGSIQHFKVNGTVVNPTDGAADQQAIVDDGHGTPRSIRLLPKPALDWTSLPDANIISSGPPVFQNGRRTALDPADNLYGRRPRTVVAWTYDNHLLLIVIDGQNGESDGMSYPELQETMDHLGWIKNATGYHGGTSSMWVNGAVVNIPSDAFPAEVTNAIAVTAAPVTTPGAPVGVVAVEGEGHFTLHWQLSSGATSYEIRRSTSAGGVYTVLGTTTAPYFTDSTIVGGTEYFYVITAKNSAGESIGSIPLGTGSSGELVVPSVAVATSGGNLVLTFSSLVGTSYQLERSTTLAIGGWEPVGAALDGTGGVLSFSQPLTPTNTFYRIRIE